MQVPALAVVFRVLSSRSGGRWHLGGNRGDRAPALDGSSAMPRGDVALTHTHTHTHTCEHIHDGSDSLRRSQARSLYRTGNGGTPAAVLQAHAHMELPKRAGGPNASVERGGNGVSPLPRKLLVPGDVQ